MFAKNLSTNELHKLNKCLAILPLGSFEQHGPYLPLGTDTILVEKIADGLGRKLKGKVVVFPSLFYSCSSEHKDFCGTIFVEEKVFYQYLSQVLSSIANSGLKKIIVLNGHGGNKKMLMKLVQEWDVREGSRLYTVDIFNEEVDKKLEQIFGEKELHAGGSESSLVTYLLKWKEKIVENENKKVFPFDFSLYSARELSADGIITTADKIVFNQKLGKKAFNCILDSVLKFFLKVISP
jgi:creatinine amidohydrolase